MVESRSDNPRPSDWSRARAVGVVFAALVFALLILYAWNARTDPVFAVRPHPLLPYVFMNDPSDPASDMAYALPWDAPLFTLGRATLDCFTRNYAAAMSVQYVFLSVFALACAACVWPRHGADAGALAGVLGAITPVAWIAALGFDDHMMIMSLVALAGACLLNLPGRPTPALALPAGVLAGLVARWACVNSNAIIAGAVIGALVAGLVFESLRGRPRGGAPGRVRWGFLVGAAALFSAGAVGAFAFRRGGEAYNFFYYSSQMQNSGGVDAVMWFATLPAYFVLAWRCQLGPMLPIGAVAAVALWRRRAPGRWPLAAWWLAVPLVLSLVPKKNTYYGFYAFAAAPVLIASALSLVRSRRVWMALAAGTIVTTLSWSMWRMAHIAPDLPGVGEESAFEESSDYSLRAPETGKHDGSVGAAIADTLRARRDRGRRLLVILDTRDANERLRYDMLMRDPDSELLLMARAGRVPPEEVEPVFAAASGDDPPPTLADFVEKMHLRQHVGAGGPVASYLEELARRAGEYRIIGRAGDWVLYDREPRVVETGGLP